MKISVIIPVYNTAKYVEKTLRSLFSQTMIYDVEFIIINDCSSDNSMDVIRTVISEYGNLHVSVLENETNLGSAATRQKGIEHATGDYTIQIDSDDWVEAGMLEQLYNTAIKHSADIVICDYYVNYTAKQLYKGQNVPQDNVQCVKKLLNRGLHSSTSNKLVRRKLYIDNGIRFVAGVNMWEDMLVMVKLCYYARTIIYQPKAYLHYVQYNQSSYTYSPSLKSLGDMEQGIELLDNFFADKADKMEYETDLLLNKLFVKIEWLKNTTGPLQKRLAGKYPEANRLIMKNRNNPVYYRLAQLSASEGHLLLANIFLKLIFLLKKLRSISNG